jgi:hypothetical protein
LVEEAGFALVVPGALGELVAQDAQLGKLTLFDGGVEKVVLHDVLLLIGAAYRVALRD